MDELSSMAFYARYCISYAHSPWYCAIHRSFRENNDCEAKLSMLRGWDKSEAAGETIP